MDEILTDKNRDKHYPVNKQPRILVAPLDWGLGHATRCIPVIKELIEKGAQVWVAGEGAQEQLLKAEFPKLPFLSLPGYRISYAKTAGGLLWKMIRQASKMQRAIRYEHQWLKKMISRHSINGVISDNRYGLYHENIPCILITHQLQIKSPAGKWTERFLQKKNYTYINKFTACWIPDTAAEPSLAGDLSHPVKQPAIPLRYTGPLTRFKLKAVQEIKGHLLILISGPEPQRSIFEQLVINGISHYPGTATVVRGLPGHHTFIPSTNMIKFCNHMSSDELNEEMLKAEYIISRSGYSTVMDAMKLGKKCILIPTPGQTEQEYLADRLLQNGMAFMMKQKAFTVQAGKDGAERFAYKIPIAEPDHSLKKSIDEFLQLCSLPAFG